MRALMRHINRVAEIVTEIKEFIIPQSFTIFGFSDNYDKFVCFPVVIPNTIQSFNLGINGDVETLVNNGNTLLYPSGGAPNTVRGRTIDFWDNGNYLLVGGAWNNLPSIVSRYTLATPYNISTATGHMGLSIPAIAYTYANTFGFHYKEDGTAIFLTNYYHKFLKKVNCPTPFSFAGATLSTDNFVIPNYLCYPVGSLNDMKFKPDGTRCYMLNQTTKTLHQFNLTEAWNINTMYDSGISRLLLATGNFNIHNSGLFIYSTGGNPTKIYQEGLSIAWDLTS